MKKIEPNTLVVLDLPELYMGSVGYYESKLGVPNNRGADSVVLCLGEVTNMPGHYIFVNRAGVIVWGLHPELFRLPTEDEV